MIHNIHPQSHNKTMTKLHNSYQVNITYLNQHLNTDENFDICTRKMNIQNRDCIFYFIDGFVKDEIMERIFEYLCTLEDKSFPSTLSEFEKRNLPYTEVELLDDFDQIITSILSGSILCLIDGYDQALNIDARTYPNRSITEPEDDRVLRGSRDSFVETLVFNTALIRRRIRDEKLKMEIFSIGKRSKTDVVLCYMDDIVDPKLLQTMKEKLSNITIPSLTMSQESLAECLIKKQWWNPFPKIRYTERPDVATSHIYEGKFILLIDNSPAAMILPTSFFDFLQEANDYYFPPLIGTYLRWVRILVFTCTLFLTPLWYLYINNPDLFPTWLSFLLINEMNAVPILIQLIIIEFLIDMIKLASLNTPSSLSGSFGVIGALVLGEFAVKAHWFVPEVLLYMAFVSLANFTQPSYELGYAFKLWRILLLLLINTLNLVGFLLGILAMLLMLISTPTVLPQSYLYPLIPFNLKKIKELLLRVPIHHHNS